MMDRKITPPLNNVGDVTISSEWNVERNCENCSNPHQGIDFAVEEGTEFYAPGEGEAYAHTSEYNTVTFEFTEGPYEGRYRVQFLHNSDVNVPVGPGNAVDVGPGDILGWTGDAGSPGSYHLHIQVIDIQTGEFVDPRIIWPGQF